MRQLDAHDSIRLSGGRQKSFPIIISRIKNLLLLSTVSLALFGAGCSSSAPPIEETTGPTIPDGWQMLTYQDGIQAIVPEKLTYYGCTQTVALQEIHGVLSLGALWTPCLHDPKLPTGKENGIAASSNEVFDDSFSGYTLFVEQHILTAKDAQSAIEKRWNGNCVLKVQDWDKNSWQIVAGKAPANQWAPSVCQLLDNVPTVKGFYNPTTQAFVYWAATPKSFPLGNDRYADDQVQLTPQT